MHTIAHLAQRFHLEPFPMDVDPAFFAGIRDT